MRGEARGRGAIENPSGRYEAWQREAFDDGWSGDGDACRAVRTVVQADRARSIFATNDSPDIAFDRSINPYRGCEHGCIYCFARPSHAWLGLSPGLDFESRLFAKADAPRLLRRALSAPSYRPAPIALGANTDPYQPIERRYAITRSLLEVLLEHRHPVLLVTKSDLVLRDLDLLAELARLHLVHVHVSLATLDNDLQRVMEPRAPRPDKRLEALRALAERAIPAGVLTSPMIPALNDHELEDLLEHAGRAGARSAGYAVLRLPMEVAGLFEAWLRRHRPDRADRVLGLVRQARAGRLYRAEFGERLRGRGAWAQLLARRFELACRRHGLSTLAPQLATGHFRRPRGDGQLGLFDVVEHS